MLAAAEGIYPKALEHGLKLLGDPAVVTTALEEVAAMVSRVVAKDPPGEPIQIRDLHAYLFQAFLRHLDELKRKELKVVSLSEMCPTSNPPCVDPLQQFEDKVLLDECLAKCDPVARDMALRRMQGFSWEEIGEAYGESAHAAEARFSYALQQARQRLNI